MDTDRTRHARALFAGIAPEYERMGRLLSLGQEARWRRFLVSSMDVPPGSLVLDVASGTGLVARELAARHAVRVVRLDPSEPMLRGGIDPDHPVAAVMGRAESLPFADGTFDGLTFTYLLRYVDDPAATMRELARVVRVDGPIACLEFHVPDRPVSRAGWRLYTRGVMPLIGSITSRAWAHTTRFLGPSIVAFYRRFPLPVQIRWWQDAGLTGVRSHTFLSGAAIVIRGVKRDG